MGTKRPLHERSPPGLDIVPASQRRRLSFSNSDLSDTRQLKGLYELCLDQVLRGLHPVSRDTAIKLAAIQCFVQYGPFYDGVQSSVRAYNLLPKEYLHAREHEKNIIEQYKNLIFPNDIAAQRKYCDVCKNLPTYGMIFFNVKEPVRNKLVPRLFGVNKECVMSVDKKNKVVLKSWPLEQLRRWAASPNTFNIDFGDYQDGYYSVQTPEAGKIKRLIAEFVDIILIKKQLVDPFGVEGDEGAIMIEDFVHRARSVPLSAEDLQQIQESEKDVRRAKPVEPRERYEQVVVPEGFEPSMDEQKLIEHYRPMTVPIPVAEFPRSYQRLPSAPPLINITQTTTPQSPIHFTQTDCYEQLPPQIFEETSKISPQNVPVFSKPPDILQIQIPPPLLPPPVSVEIIDNSREKKPFQPSTSPQTITTKVDLIQEQSEQHHFSAFTSNQIAYEICSKEGILHRSYEQHFENTKNLQSFTEVIERTIKRLIDCSQQTFNFNLPHLNNEERASAIKLGEDTIRHQAVLFLACTAQAIEWTSESQRFGPKYGRACMAINQGGDYLCELNQCTKELVVLYSNPQFTTQILSIINSLNEAFINFLGKLHPDSNEKRSQFLSTASFVGESVFILLNSLNADETEAIEEKNFFNNLNEAIQNVANSTAGLVLQAKNVSGSPTDFPRDNIIQAATRVALYTSEAIALSRVLTSIMAHPACQRRIQRITKLVFISINELLELAKSEAFDQFKLTGKTEYYQNLQKYALTTEIAL
uniref:FERM domain-containing protein n=1 Tax=Meloidogyne incognita TaxID=6306 RepID=A0A914M5B0_MELIC